MSMVRHPQTQAERRNFENDGGAEGIVVQYRKRTRLPTNYDDMQPRANNCWKKHRRNKWRRVA